MRKTYMSFGALPLLAASLARMPMRMAEGTETGAPPAGITENGSATTYTPTEEEQERKPGETATPPEARDDRPAEWPEGVNSWAEFGALSPEERAKAYAPKEEATTEEPAKEEPQGVDAIVDRALEGAAPEVAEKARPFVKLFAENGTLTDAEVSEAAKATGYSEEMIRTYMTGSETIAAEAVAPVYALVGGQENFAGFQEWVNEALGPDDHAKINEALGLDAQGLRVKGVPNAEALKSFTDAYLASGRGPAPRDLTTEARTTSSEETALTDAFGSIEEMSKAMNDPRYRSDPSYRKQVEAKVGRSNF